VHRAAGGAGPGWEGGRGGGEAGGGHWGGLALGGLCNVEGIREGRIEGRIEGSIERVRRRGRMELVEYSISSEIRIHYVAVDA